MIGFNEFVNERVVGVADRMPFEPKICAMSTVCKYFLEGKCRFGSKCRNLHPNSKPTLTYSRVTSCAGLL